VLDIDPKNLTDALARLLARDPSGRGRSAVPVAWVSAKGNVRPENQDRVLVAACPGVVVGILADGMGGMRDGARAAALAAGAIGAYCAAAAAHTHPERLLVEALRYANEEVFRLLAGEGGATVVVAAVSAAGRFVAHAGDSRAYLAGSENGLTQITTDDTVKAQLERMGRPADDGARLHSQLLQFIGVGPSLEPHVAAVPPGGRGVILTTDGVHSAPPTVLDWLARGSTHLVPLADRLLSASDGKDNGTVLVVGFQSEHPSLPGPGFAEFWMPGEHVIVISGAGRSPLPPRYRDALPPPAPAPAPAAERQEKAKRQEKAETRKPRTKKSRGKDEAPITIRVEGLPKAERQLPIMTFEEPGVPTPDADTVRQDEPAVDPTENDAGES
jgi:serine/threonine protein phosphatase PrpC